MSKEQENPSAFPYDEINHNGEPGAIYRQHVGLTMRDYFAAKAMPVVLNKYWFRWRWPLCYLRMIFRSGVGRTVHHVNYRESAVESYRIADELLKARETN